MPVSVRARQGTDGDRRIGRAKHRGADLGNAGAAQARHHSQPRDIGGLALIRAHAERGVTLEMFDRAIALPMRQRDIVAGHIMLQIDKGLALARHTPDRDTLLRIIRTGQGFERTRLEAALCGSFGAQLPALGEGLFQ